MDRNSTRLLVAPALAGITLILTGALVTGSAQTPPPDSQAAPSEIQKTQILTADQLTDLVAPIALYTDGLLSQVLVASTYPLEVVEAQQWLQQNPTLRGTQLTDAAKQQSWDPSVQALVAFPDVLNRLNENVGWTRDLGNAFLAQEADVMAAVQRLRASAQANGRLTSTSQQTVSTDTQSGQPAIVIQPANPDVIYVPVYDPAYVWGPPVVGYYPPLFYPAFGFGWGSGINLGLCFSSWGGWGGWGWGPNWFGRTVVVNNNFFHRNGFRGGAGFDRANWVHNPNHRLGIPYPNRQVAGRFPGNSPVTRGNVGGPGVRNPMIPPNGGRNSFQGGANRMAIPGNPGRTATPGNPGRMATPGNPGNPQAFPGMSPRGGAARSFPAPPSRQMQTVPHMNPGFGGGGMRGFPGGGHGFGGGGGMRGPGGGGGGFGGHGGGGGPRGGGGGRR
jgi:hypothetical protein